MRRRVTFWLLRSRAETARFALTAKPPSVNRTFFER